MSNVTSADKKIADKVYSVYAKLRKEMIAEISNVAYNTRNFPALLVSNIRKYNDKFNKEYLELVNDPDGGFKDVFRKFTKDDLTKAYKDSPEVLAALKYL